MRPRHADLLCRYGVRGVRQVQHDELLSGWPTLRRGLTQGHAALSFWTDRRHYASDHTIIGPIGRLGTTALPVPSGPRVFRSSRKIVLHFEE